MAKLGVFKLRRRQGEWESAMLSMDGRPIMTSDRSLDARLHHDDPQLSLISTRNRQVGVQADIPLIFRPWVRYSHPYKLESHVIFVVIHDCGSQWFPDSSPAA